jgi:hypothetical protein
VTFLLEHLDTLIMIILGIGLLAASGRMTVEKPQRASFVRVGAIIMIAGGSLLLLTSETRSGETVQATDDGVATVAFPGRPTRSFRAASETPNGAERETYDYKPAGRDLNYKLSRSPLIETSPMSDTERIEAMVANFQAHGATVTNRASVEKNGITIHSFRFTSPEANATSSIRVVFAGNQIYRVIATAGKSEQEPPEFERFLASFTVRAGVK